MCAHRVMRTALDVIAFPQREQRENNPFPKEKQFSGLFFLDANIANALCFNMLLCCFLFRAIVFLLILFVVVVSVCRHDKNSYFIVVDGIYQTMFLRNTSRPLI